MPELGEAIFGRASCILGRGFSKSNLFNMRSFYVCYPNFPDASRKLTWSHYCELLSISDPDARSFYEKETVNSNWSVRELKRQIKGAKDMPIREINQKELDKFATEKVYWWGKEWIDVDLYKVLVFILATNPQLEAEAREKFALTDDDFRHALKNAPPGVFWGPFAENRWIAVNKRFGFDPPLPMPKINWEDRLERRIYKNFI